MRNQPVFFSSAGRRVGRIISSVENAAVDDLRHAELIEEMVNSVRLLVDDLAHRTRQLVAVVLKAATRIEALE